SKASRENAFVARSWATRRIASLVAKVAAKPRDRAAQPDAAGTDDLAPVAAEIAALALEHGALTAYTQFLVDPQAGLSDRAAVARSVRTALADLASQGQTGAATRQAFALRQRQAQLSQRAAGADGASVRYVCDTALVRRVDRWVDLRVLTKGDAKP